MIFRLEPGRDSGCESCVPRAHDLSLLHRTHASGGPAETHDYLQAPSSLSSGGRHRGRGYQGWQCWRRDVPSDGNRSWHRQKFVQSFGLYPQQYSSQVGWSKNTQFLHMLGVLTPLISNLANKRPLRNFSAIPLAIQINGNE